VRQILQNEAEKLCQAASVSSVMPVEQVDDTAATAAAGNSHTDAVASSIETQRSDKAVADSVSATNPCISVARSAPQRYYKEITTYGEVVFNVWTLYTAQ